MWLLSTDRAELHYFSSAEAVDGGYAILSHTWEGEEQTFQQVLAISERCRRYGANPREDPELSSKIRECCKLAEKHGYRWVWIDSSCIDKTSSSELSESINCMYQWYSQAEICYAYLVDVPSDCIPEALDSAFRNSRWHTRGWTLQELIAPAFVVFLSVSWVELGNRAELAGVLFDVTRIPPEVFTREKLPSDYSISVRMYWAAPRKTTRVEDEAYCLMGLFSVSMPTNYGEGEAAFTRLQLELMRHRTDTSLFTFGKGLPHGHWGAHGITLSPNQDVYGGWKYLLASSPREFLAPTLYTPESSARELYPPPRHSTVAPPFDDIELPRITVTSYGVECRLPVIEVDASLMIAVLLCEVGGDHLGLFLRPDPSGTDPKRPRYHTGCVYHKHGEQHGYVARMVILGRELNHLELNGKHVHAAWRTIYIVLRPPELTGYSRIGQLRINSEPSQPFRFPHWLASRFSALRFNMFQRSSGKGENMVYSTQLCFQQSWTSERISVFLGMCENGFHWANVIISDPQRPTPNAHRSEVTPIHSRPEDRIQSWAAWSRDFGDADRTVRLSFTRCKRRPEDTLVVHVELFGRVYEEMLREANVYFPSRADLRNGGRPRPHPAAQAAVLSAPRSPAPFAHAAPWSPSVEKMRFLGLCGRLYEEMLGEGSIQYPSRVDVQNGARRPPHPVAPRAPVAFPPSVPIIVAPLPPSTSFENARGMMHSLSDDVYYERTARERSLSASRSRADLQNGARPSSRSAPQAAVRPASRPSMLAGPHGDYHLPPASLDSSSDRSLSPISPRRLSPTAYHGVELYRR